MIGPVSDIGMWRLGIKEREMIFVAVIVVLASALLAVVAEASYLRGLFDALREAQRLRALETPPEPNRQETSHGTT